MRILLAPMEGLLDSMLRDTITRVGGIDLCVSEFIRVNDTLLPAHRFYKVVPELQNQCRTSSSVPVRVQLLGSDPICIAENAAKVASLGASGIDLNFGCPAPTVNRNRGGAVLLKEPELLYEILRAVRKAVPQDVSVTAKMRLGFDSTELALVCAKALEEGGAEEIVVHARTKTDGYKPPAYWEWIAKIKESARIPIVANGEIWTVDDAKRCQEISGCQDLMIGRGAISNPALALMIRGQRANPLPWDEIVQLLIQFYTMMQNFIPSKNQAGRIKQWLHYLSREYPEAKECFENLKRLTSPTEILSVMEETRIVKN
jgi:tRNA-dihydrouridine synthase C